MLIKILILVSAFSFLYYGLTFFTKSKMKEEFERYNLAKFRYMIGILQLLGGFGLLVGLMWNVALIISSGGLSLLMMIGFGVRLKMKDGILDSLPSFFFMLLNGYIWLNAIGIIK